MSELDRSTMGTYLPKNKESMPKVSVRIPKEHYEKLIALEGNRSEHLRAAIQMYLNL